MYVWIDSCAAAVPENSVAAAETSYIMSMSSSSHGDSGVGDGMGGSSDWVHSVLERARGFDRSVGISCENTAM